MTESIDVGVLVVEDDEPTRAYLIASVAGTQGLQPIGEAGTVADGRRILQAEKPAVMLVDLQLPDGNGLELIRATRKLSPDTQSLVISVFGDEESVLSSIAAGAQGYLLKDSTPKRIGEAVLDLLAGGAPISPPIARYLLLRFQTPLQKAPHPTSTAGAPALTTREREVLELVVKGFTFPEIAKGLDISPHTVATHIRRIYQKLEVRSRSEAVYEALQQGIVTIGSESSR